MKANVTRHVTFLGSRLDYCSILNISPHRYVLYRRIDPIQRMATHPVVTIGADGHHPSVHVGMLECPSHSRGNDLAALPHMAILDAVARTGDCRFPLGFVRDARPLVGAVGAEMNRGIAYGVSVVGDISGVLIGTVGFAEGRIGVGKTDVFGDGLGQQNKNSFCQSSVLLVRFREQVEDESLIFGILNLSKRPNHGPVRVLVLILSLNQVIVLRDFENPTGCVSGHARTLCHAACL